MTRPCNLGKFEVTQGQWQAVVGSNPSHFKDDLSRPVEKVSWEATGLFLAKLTERPGRLSLRFGLPTEAPWEFACRAGTETAFPYGDDESLPPQFAWFHKNSNGLTHPVGQRQANPFGLYDLSGNV